MWPSLRRHPTPATTVLGAARLLGNGPSSAIRVFHHGVGDAPIPIIPPRSGRGRVPKPRLSERGSRTKTRSQNKVPKPPPMEGRRQYRSFLARAPRVRGLQRYAKDGAIIRPVLASGVAPLALDRNRHASSFRSPPPARGRRQSARRMREQYSTPTRATQTHSRPSLPGRQVGRPLWHLFGVLEGYGRSPRVGWVNGETQEAL